MSWFEETATNLITAIPFYKSMIPQVAGLHCGNDEFGGEATQWIYGQGTPSVRTVINHHGEVWIYKNGDGETVGFGSLALSTWIIDGTEVDVQYIPMLGVFDEHQGMPTTPPKYCYQIVDHLLDEAEFRADRPPIVVLAVHPENAKAIQLYTNCGFEWITTSDGFRRMFLSLA